MMRLATGTLLLIIGACPGRVGDGTAGPLVKGLPQKLGTGKANMDPFLFPTAFLDWCDSCRRLQLAGIIPAIALGAKSSQEPWCQGRPGSRQAIKNEKIGMRSRRLLDLPVQGLNGLA